MNFTLTLTGENPSELAQFLEALSGVQGSKPKTRTLPLGIVTDTALANLEGINDASGGSLPENGAAVTEKATTTTTKAAPRGKKKAEGKAEDKAAVEANVQPEEDFGAAFSNGAADASAGDDYDFGLDMGQKTTGWTVEEVREKAKEVVNAGKQLQLREHLNAFGAASISTLDASNYDAFMLRMNSINF